MQRRQDTTNLLDSSLGHYRVLDQLGRGGMGEVFVAEDQRLRRRVALKVLPPELAAEPRHLERFKREAWSIAALNHPNIVSIYSVEEAEGLHFLVLELIEGKTLADLLSAASPMPLDRVLEIALPLTEALEAAHARGVVHRDLKPRNIMVSQEGRVKVLDFGIARMARPDDGSDPSSSETSLTRTGGAIGTASYMSPEQIQERPVDRRSDLFSIGIVLYEMATGRHPFRRKSHLATMAAILCETPPPPSTLSSELPARFNEIVKLCLAKEPFLRYRGAAELRADLLRLVDREETTDSTVADGLSSLPGSDSNSSSILGRTHPRLPARPRCFGREREVHELAEALCNDPLPVPVLGPAGAGKTTITLAALHERRVAERFGSRRWLIRCDGATSRDGLVGVIARILCPNAIPPLEPRIFRDLEEAPAVLALDNLETPWERDTAAVEDLLTELAAIQGLALVVSLRGEQRPFGPSWREPIHVGPLNPESARSAFLAVAGERYRNDPELDPLLSVLDGLALAIVLLASQAEGEPNLSTLHLRWQERRTALLQRADARERQHSLEASLGLSIGSPRMTDESRRLLSILALLPEGVLWENLEDLLPGYGSEGASTLRKVGLAFDQGSRLRMLAPIREHLRKNYPPQRNDLDRTINHYLILSRLGEKIGCEEGADAVHRLRSEIGNLEPMICLGLELFNPVPALQAALAYAHIVRLTGMGSLAVLAGARLVAQQAGLVELEAECARSQGDIDLHRSRFVDAQDHCKQALQLYKQIGDLSGEARCIAILAETHLFRTALTEADRLFEEAYSRFCTLGDLPGEAQCLLGLGTSALFRSDLSAAYSYLQKAQTLYKRADNLRGEANCLQKLAQVSLGRRDFDSAGSYYESALSLFRKAGSLLGEALSTSNLGNVMLHRGDASAALPYLERGLVLNRRAGSLLGEANCLRYLGDTEVALSNPDRASSFFEQARQCFWRIGHPLGEAHCSEGLADCSSSRSDFAAARKWYEHALSLFILVPDQLSIGRIHLHLALLFPFGSPERFSHIEAARQAWERAGILDQRRCELEEALQTNSTPA